MKGNGKLYICGGPIGNLEDITLRALNVLKEADFIACEDTRRTKKLLAHYNIPGRLFSCHEHNEKKRLNYIRELIREGKTVALITNAGMPAISDPGSIIAGVVAQEAPVIIVPGVSAVTAALSISGFSGDEFYFAGFLPRKGKEREQKLKRMATFTCPIIIYESPQRIKETLLDLIEILGEKHEAVLARELTKVHEDVLRGSLGEIHEVLQDYPEIKGEITLVMAGKQEEKEELHLDEVTRLISFLFSCGFSSKEVMKGVQVVFQLPRNQSYELTLRWQDGHLEK